MYDKLKFVERSLSNSRKIFRFLNWMDEIMQIYYYLTFHGSNNSKWGDILKALMHSCSFFYYLMDNLVFYSNIGLISENNMFISLKNIKQYFSLLRNIIKMYVDIRKYFVLTSKMTILLEKINLSSKQDKEKDLLDSIIKMRSSLLYLKLCIIHNFIRIVIILCSLKIWPFFNLIHPIFASFLGLIHAFITFYKEILDIVKINNEQSENNKLLKENLVIS